MSSEHFYSVEFPNYSMEARVYFLNDFGLSLGNTGPTFRGSKSLEEEMEHFGKVIPVVHHEISMLT